MRAARLFSAVAITNVFIVSAATCPGVPAAPANAFRLAPGWKAARVLTDLRDPRHMVIDSKGRLLVVESIWAISQHEVGSNGCVTSSRILSLGDYDITHGIYLSPDGRTLFASTAATVYSWPYDPVTGDVGARRPLVTGMEQNWEPRPITILRNRPNILVVSYPSHPETNITSKRAAVKAFDISAAPPRGFNFYSDGKVVGYGLRDTGAMDFDGNNMLWGLDSGPGEMTRTPMAGRAYNLKNNPATELNYLGDAAAPQGSWYGYPRCYTVSQPSEITDRKFKVGDQFLEAPSRTMNDAECVGRSVAARLALPAGLNPVAARFDAKFQNLYITMTGREEGNPVGGSKVLVVPFKRGGTGAYEPVGTSGYSDILSAPVLGSCSGAACLVRPTGMSFDKAGRLYITTRDGSVYMLVGPS